MPETITVSAVVTADAPEQYLRVCVCDISAEDMADALMFGITCEHHNAVKLLSIMKQSVAIAFDHTADNGDFAPLTLAEGIELVKGNR